MKIGSGALKEMDALAVQTVDLHGEAGFSELFLSLNEAKRERGVRHSREDQGNEDRPRRRV